MKRQTVTVAMMALAVGAMFGPGLSRSVIRPAIAEDNSAAQPDTSANSCPKCKGAMASGYIRDYWNQNSMQPSSWSPTGEKQHLFSLGKHIEIAASRCTNCGYLELYAK